MRALTVGPSSLCDALADAGWEVDVADRGFDYMAYERTHYDLLHATGDEDTLHHAFELMLRFCSCKWILEAPSDTALMSDMDQWSKGNGLWSNLTTDLDTDVASRVHEFFSAQAE